AIGTSILTIAFRPEATPYHFAINIPANKIQEALEWTKARVAILKEGPEEIQDFRSWNAEAFYFYDVDKNIVELIARKNLNNASNEKFGPDQFLELSEIGLPTTDIEKEFDILHRLTGIKVYDGTFDRFCAIGDENGLFICIDKDKKDWFPTNDKAFASAFEIRFSVKKATYRFVYENGKLKGGMSHNLNT
ncbi:MAG: VOC family protein, partial [Pricia sp.]|nr:VOC family protein [Pricia sp.]